MCVYMCAFVSITSFIPWSSADGSYRRPSSQSAAVAAAAAGSDSDAEVHAAAVAVEDDDVDDVVGPAWPRRWSAVVGTETGTRMSLPFIPQSHNIRPESDRDWDRDLDLGFGSMGRRSVENSCLGCCQLSCQAGPGPVRWRPSPSPSQDKRAPSVLPYCPLWPEQPTRRPASLQRPAGETLAPPVASEIVPRFPLWATVSCCRRQVPPTNRTRATFSLEFLGPRTCETESCWLSLCLSAFWCCLLQCQLSCCSALCGRSYAASLIPPSLPPG